MESTLSHDLFAFSSPNAIHGGMHSAPNHQLVHQYDHSRHHQFMPELDAIPAQMRSGFQQSSPFAPRMPNELSQPYASTSSSAMFGGFGVQHPTNAQLYQPNGLGDHRTFTSTISPMKLTPLSINPHNSSLQRSPTSSSPSSTSGRTQTFSRRTDGVTGSPPRTGKSDVLFCRTASPHGRQRTAQACEKCRDRKTKCSGERPICKRCKDRGLTCEWAPETRIRGPQRKHKQSRLSSEDLDSPTSNLSTLPSPHPHPNSPLNAGAKLDAPDSKALDNAPPQAPGLPPLLNTSGRIIGVVVDPRGADPRGVKWPAGLSSAVQRGEDAKMIMGKPIVPITPSSDCWGSISEAEVVDPVEFMAIRRQFPNGVDLFDAEGFLKRHKKGESSGSSDNSSPPSADCHMLSASNSDEIAPVPHYTEHIPLHMPNPLDIDMMGTYDFQYPSPPVIDPQLFALFAGEHTEFAHAAMLHGGFIADDKTPTADANARRDEEFMEQIFDTEAFEQSFHP